MDILILLSGYLCDYDEIATNNRDTNDLLKKSICKSVERQLDYMCNSSEITIQDKECCLRYFRKAIYSCK